MRASTGFEPVTSAIPVRCSINWAVKPHIGSEVNLFIHIFSCSEMMWNIYEIRPIWMTDVKYIWNLNPVEALIFFRLLPSNCLNWEIYCDHHSSLSSTTVVVQIWISYIYFTKVIYWGLNVCWYSSSLRRQNSALSTWSVDKRPLASRVILTRESKKRINIWDPLSGHIVCNWSIRLHEVGALLNKNLSMFGNLKSWINMFWWMKVFFFWLTLNKFVRFIKHNFGR